MARRQFVAVVSAAALFTLSQTATAAGPATTFSFGAAPATKALLGARSYFSFSTRPGQTIRDAIVVTNGSSKAQTLAVGASIGVTASNSGYGYVGAFSHCRSAACWIHGLPADVKLGPQARKTIPFTVVVPAGTRNRQYLAGITVQPAKRPAPVKVGSRGGVGASATVITRVNVGVAITVGSLASLPRKLEIERLRIVSSDGPPRILISERNTGSTFVQAKGTAVCLDGASRYAYPLVSRTILPADRAVLTLTGSGLRRGADLRCTATLHFGGSTTPAMWRGRVSVPSSRPPTVIQTGSHAFSEVPASHIPRWAIALIAGGGTLVLALLVVIVMLIRRRPPPASA